MRTSVDLNRFGGAMGHYAVNRGEPHAPPLRPFQYEQLVP
jgi:hypothetical protein